MARSFNGTTDRIDVANESNFDFDFASTFSVAFWWYATTNGGFNRMVAKSTTGAGGPLGWAVVSDTGTSNPKVTFELRGDPAQSITIHGVREWPQNAWHHVCCTYDGTFTAAGTLIYSEGTLESMTGGPSGSGGSTLNNIPLQLGCRGGTSTPELFFPGNLAGLGVWNSVLTAANATTLASGANPLSVANANLVATLPLCGDASPEPDKKSNNNGTLTGTAKVAGPPQFVGCQGDATEWLFTA
jgi:hypothetical protein